MRHRAVADDVLVEEIRLLIGRGWRMTVVQLAASLTVSEDRIRAAVNSSPSFAKVREGRLFFVELA